MTVDVSPLTFEHLRDALGIGVAAPRLAWKTDAPAGWRQTAYEIEIVTERGVETSGVVQSAESVLVDWPFAPLASRERATLRVRLFGADDTASAWSPAARVEAGLLDAEDWIAGVVGPAIGRYLTGDAVILRPAGEATVAGQRLCPSCGQRSCPQPRSRRPRQG